MKIINPFTTFQTLAQWARDSNLLGIDKLIEKPRHPEIPVVNDISELFQQRADAARI